MMRFPALPLLLCCAVLFGPTANAQRTFGTLVIVESEPIPKAASPLSAETAAEWRLVELVHAPLFTESPTGALEPHLASGLKVLDGGRKLVVSLSENARWAVGKDVSAVDVVYTYTLARAGKWNKAWVDLLRPVTGVDRAANGFDIVFELRAPVKDPKRLLVVPIVPSGLHGPLNDPDRQRPLPLSSLGAGPFAPKGPTAPNTFVASAHAIKKPRISEVRILTTGSRRAALEIVRLQGDAVTFDVAPEDLPSLPSELGGRTLEMPVRELLAIAWTKKGGAITEGGVRAALEQGLDRAELFAPGEGAGRPWVPGGAGGSATGRTGRAGRAAGGRLEPPTAASRLPQAAGQCASGGAHGPSAGRCGRPRRHAAGRHPTPADGADRHPARGGSQAALRVPQPGALRPVRGRSGPL